MQTSPGTWTNPSGGVYSIKVGKYGETDYNTWTDDGSNNPIDVTISGSAFSAVTENSNGTVSLYGNSGGTNMLLYVFTKPTTASWISSGPTVTSITDNTIFVPSDTVSNTDFTLLKNGSAYANTNISLTGPGAQPPSDARGYTYALTYDGSAYYRRTIDSKSYEDFYYDDSWTSDVSGAASNRQTTSNRILNVVGTIPESTVITGVPSTGYSRDHANRALWYHPQNPATQYYYGMYITGNNTNIYAILAIWDPAGTNWAYQSFIVGQQQTMTFTSGTETISVQDWVYSAEPEGSGYVAPVTSNGGGKPDRYPLIMTNLFNRNRSLYSIGMTHKDTWDLFL